MLRHVAMEVSKSLKTAVFAFLVHDSDIAAYWLYENGVIKDEFNSAPDYFEEKVTEKERARVRGNSDVLLPLCVAGTTRKDIEAVIRPADEPPLMAEGILTDLAPLLGIDDARIGLGFTYFEEDGENVLPDAAEFEPLGKGAERKKAPAPTAATEPAFSMPDMFPPAIGMLTQCWSGKHEKMVEAFSKMLPGQENKDMLKQLRTGFDRGARDFLKQSVLPNRPTIEELKAARDEGPSALAKLLTERAPTMLGSIGVDAVREKLEQFVAALLAQGLDPHAKDHHGNTVLGAAEQLGEGSPIYQMLKAAADKKS